MVISILLRKLELYGFKSFAEKTEIEFGNGVTAIVGPNGSGKSNITDAIRWVLGEQSIRSLRGAKAEDVIFAGSTGRRHMGVAEVSLFFENNDGVLSLDFNEVVITRRVFRSGDSEYYINKSSCRLKDIHDLLAGTGLGRDAMSVISQNKIDEVLNSKPEDRRLLFEEAAGLTKYKQRKKDALRKLDDTEQNLVRVNDITTEIEVQLDPLAESAARTEEYNTLNADLLICQVSILLNRLSKAERMVESAKFQQEALADDEIRTSTALSVREADKERLSADLAKEEEHITAQITQINSISTELERLDGQAGIIQERIKQGMITKDRLHTEQTANQVEVEEVSQRLAKLNSQLAEKKVELVDLRQVVESVIENYKNNNELISHYEKLLETETEQTFENLQDIANYRNTVANIDKEIIKLNLRRTNCEAELRDIDSQLEGTKKSQNALLLECEQLKSSYVSLNTSYQSLISQKQELDNSRSALCNQENHLLSNLNECRSRLKILMTMQQELEGFGRGIKSVLKCNAPWRNGVCGAVTQILEVDNKYVTAIEVALGGALQHIITENESIAKQAINYLKVNNMGRATFLPLNTIKPQRRRDYELSASKAAGALGFASDLVSCAPKFHGVLEYLLGRTIIADNIDAAYEIARCHSFAIKVVTLDGELINPGGSMTGGASGKRDTSFLSRDQDIKNAQIKVNEISDKHNSIIKNISKNEDALSEINAQISLCISRKQEYEVRQAELNVLAEKTKGDIDRIKFAQKTLIAEIQGYDEERVSLEKKAQSSKLAITELESRSFRHNQQIDDWRNILKDLQNSKETLNIKITESKVNISALEQNISAINDNVSQLTKFKLSIENKLHTLQQEQNSTANQILEANEELNKAACLRSSLNDKKTILEGEYKLSYGKKIDTLLAIQNLDKELKELRRKHTDLQGRLHEAELLFTKYNYEVTRCNEDLRDQYTMTLEQARTIYSNEHPTELAQRAKQLENKIASLGPINPAAIEEYARLRERYQFLQKQCEDLMSAKNYLSSIISDIDNTMAKQFNAAFNKINEYFSEIFVQLFGGGKAYLQFNNPENLLETGVEVIVQPPGKKLQNLVLLSGGERALTVIALLFAFLSYRPAPFIVVDEIDAPLDEANLRRFSSFLRDYSQNTQFIVVTHRKGTMEAADVMHGVTLEEAGISRLISVKFADKAG